MQVDFDTAGAHIDVSTVRGIHKSVDFNINPADFTQRGDRSRHLKRKGNRAVLEVINVQPAYLLGIFEIEVAKKREVSVDTGAVDFGSPSLMSVLSLSNSIF